MDRRHFLEKTGSILFAGPVTGSIHAAISRPVARLREEPAPIEWRRDTPEKAGLSRDRLAEARDRVEGRGCIVRNGILVFEWGDIARGGDIASAMKPILSILLLIAVQEGRIGGVDSRVSEWEPRLAALNGGKDGRITWRHLASQTSGYGLMEEPGAAYSYNDYALALYYDTLMKCVFRESGSSVLLSRLGRPLRFEDPRTFEAFGPDDRPGRLSISMRDLARFGWMILRGGRKGRRAVLRSDLLRMSLDSVVPVDTPLTRGLEADMLPGQRTIGGSRNITSIGPGFYTFNWWKNGLDRLGRRLLVDAPADTILASGHGGRRVLLLLPSLKMLACWNDSRISDHDESPGNPKSELNRAVKALVGAVVDRPGPR